MSKIDPVLVPFWGQVWQKIRKNEVPKKHQKTCQKKDTKMDTKIEQFGGHFETHFKTIRNLGSLAPSWASLDPSWGNFGVILCRLGGQTL